MMVLFIGVMLAMWRVFRPESLIVVGKPGEKGKAKGLKVLKKAIISEEAHPEDDKLASIILKDKSFEVQGFLNSTGEVLRRIIAAVNRKDTDELKHLVTPAIAKRIAGSFKDGLAIELLRIRSVEIIDAGADGSKLFVVAAIESEQTALVKDSSGKVTEGDDNYIENVTDKWKFVKNLRDKHPDWVLSEIVP